MRGALLVLLAVGGAARADATVPGSGKPTVGESPHALAKSADRWQGKCAARLEQARIDAAKRDSIFLLARVEEVTREYAEPANPTAKNTIDLVELRLDEAVLNRQNSGPIFFAAEVLPRSRAWSADDSTTANAWTNVGDGAQNISIYRQTRTFEGSISSFEMQQLLPRAALARLVDAIFKPAVDDCLRLGGR